MLSYINYKVSTLNMNCGTELYLVALFESDSEKEHEIQAELATLVRRKKVAAGQWEKESRIGILDEWFYLMKDPLKEFAKNIPNRNIDVDWDKMDSFFREVVLKNYEKMEDAYTVINKVYNLENSITEESR